MDLVTWEVLLEVKQGLALQLGDNSARENGLDNDMALLATVISGLDDVGGFILKVHFVIIVKVNCLFLDPLNVINLGCWRRFAAFLGLREG